MQKNNLIKIILGAVVIFAAGAYAADKDPKPLFELFDPGTEKIIQYEKYGEFTGIGTFDYKYKIKDIDSLARASGEGIDPNTSVKNDPAYNKFRKKRRPKGLHWKHVGTDNPEADFFIWATAYEEDPGVRLFFTARAMEAGGLYNHALKTYRAAMILYPNSMCWNRELTWTWLIAPTAWSEIVNLTRMHPELELKLAGAYVKTEAAIGGDPRKNRVAVTPGRFVRYTAEERQKDYADVAGLKVVERRGGKVSCVKYSNGQWGMQVDGKPFIVRGIFYAPTKIGMDYRWNWMQADENRNGLNDVAYETWVDKNRNNRQNKDEPRVGDFKVLKEMGCNTIRIFNTLDLNKELLRDLYKTYGIRVIICDPFGAYTVHSGADWNRGTDYTSPRQRKSMKEAVRKTVQECKDEDWLLGYILGNENNMPSDYTGVNASRTRASSQPEVYAKFLNEVAEMVHTLDPEHPVGVGNLRLGLVEYYALYAPELDFIGVNDYPGISGFGSLWIRAHRLMDRPVLITEFGCDAYATEKGVDEDVQAVYHRNGWEDIMYNAAGSPGEGNALGGIIFEWLDEWWKDTRGDPLNRQNTAPTAEMAFPDGWSQEEWLGIAGQGSGNRSPFQRVLRKVYFEYKKMWNQ